MVDKKKYHGGLKVLLSLLFIMLLGISSTSYASVTGEMTNKRAKYIFDCLLTDTYNPGRNWYDNYDCVTNYSVPNGGYDTEKISLYNTYYSDEYFESFSDKFNELDQNYNSSIGVEHYIFSGIVANNGTTFGVICIPNNNGIGNDLPHIKIFKRYGGYNGNSNWIVCTIDADEQYNNKSIFVISVTSSVVGGWRISQSLPVYVRTRNAISPYNPFSFYNNSDTVITSNYGFCCLRNQSVYSTSTLNATVTSKLDATQPYILKSYYEEIEPTPIPTPTPEGSGTITNPSGEVTGQVDLSGIENGIKDIKDTISGEMQAVRDTISGETGKVINTLTDVPDISEQHISSGDITSALGFDFMADPYDNFWFLMTTGLSGALTNTVRKIPVNWLGYNGYFDLDELNFNYPQSIRNILTTVSTVSMVWILVKWWKIIIDKLSSGDVDEVLAMNEEERYNRFILRGY